MAGLSVSIILPTLNEVAALPVVLQRLRRELEGSRAEIIVVDDGSTDGTVAAARAADPEARVLERRGERGLASAVLAGWQLARGDWVVVMDADGQHPPEAAAALLRRAERGDADIVAATRFAPGGSAPGLGPVRRFITRASARAARVSLAPLRANRVTDPTTGFFAARRTLIDAAAVPPHGFKVFLDVVAAAPAARIKEVPFAFDARTRGKSKLTAAVAAAFAWQLVTLAARDRLYRRAVMFGAVGAAGVVVNLGALFALTSFTAVHYVIASAIAVELAILHNFAWHDLGTFRDLRAGPWYTRLLRFNTLSLGTLVVNVATLWLLVERGGFALGPAAVLAVAASAALNFFGNLAWTYGPRGPRGSAARGSSGSSRRAAPSREAGP